MAYANKYKIPFRELHSSVLWETYILERDFSGTVTELTGTASPTITEYRPENDNDYDWIRPSICTIGMTSMTDMQFIEFFTSDQKKYKIKVYRNSILLWAGWIVPDAYKEPYMTPSYEVYISATDGLLSLKDISWARRGTVEPVYTGKKSLHKGLESCLNKLDLQEVNIWEGATIYEQNHLDAYTNSPFTQTYFDCERFYDKDGEPLDCYTVLLEILKATNCQIWMENGYWNIVPENARKSSYYRRDFLWIDTGYYALTVVQNPELYDPGVTIDNDSYQLYAEPELSFRPAWKSFQLKQDYGYDNNLLRNKNFSKHGTWNCAIGIDNFVYFTYSETFNRDNYLEWNLGYVLENTTENEYLNVEVKFYGPDDLVVEVMVLLDRSGTDYTLSSSISSEIATWKTGTHYIYSMPLSGKESLNEDADYIGFLPKKSNNIPEDGTLKFRIYQPHKLTGSTEVDGMIGFDLKDIKVSLSRNDAALTDTTVTTNINANNVYIPPVMEMMLGDLPYPYTKTVYDVPPADVGDSGYLVLPRGESFTFVNQALVYDGGLYWLDGTTYKLTSLWSIRDRNQYNTLRNVIADEISVNHLDPQWILTCDFYGYVGYGNTIIEGTKKYMILRGTQNAYNKEWNFELFEIADTEQGYLKLRSGGYVTLRGGGKIKIR